MLKTVGELRLALAVFNDMTELRIQVEVSVGYDGETELRDKYVAGLEKVIPGVVRFAVEDMPYVPPPPPPPPPKNYVVWEKVGDGWVPSDPVTEEDAKGRRNSLFNLGVFTVQATRIDPRNPPKPGELYEKPVYLK